MPTMWVCGDANDPFARARWCQTRWLEKVAREGVERAWDDDKWGILRYKKQDPFH
jgi:hypothetical protein